MWITHTVKLNSMYQHSQSILRLQYDTFLCEKAYLRQHCWCGSWFYPLLFDWIVKSLWIWMTHCRQEKYNFPQFSSLQDFNDSHYRCFFLLLSHLVKHLWILLHSASCTFQCLKMNKRTAWFDQFYICFWYWIHLYILWRCEVFEIRLPDIWQTV